MNDKIKVCHMTSGHLSDDVRIFHKQCVSLAKAGFETYLVAPGESSRRKGVKIVGIGRQTPSRSKKNIKCKFFLFRHIYRFMEFVLFMGRRYVFARLIYAKSLKINADVYHFHDPDLLPFGLKLKRRGRVVIYDSHEHHSRNLWERVELDKARKTPLPLQITRKIIARIHDSVENRACKKLDAIICASPTMIDYFQSRGANTQTITNYPIIYDCDSLPTRNRERKLCFAGGVRPDWLHEKVVSLLKECNATYELAGPHDEQYLSVLESLDGWQRVAFKGRIRFDEVAPMIRGNAVGICLMVHRANAFGNMGTLGVNKLFEYMQNGIPVICSDHVIWKELVDAENCGISVDPYKPEAIKEAILYLLNNPDEADRMGENGHTAVLREYNWSTQERKLLDFYDDIIVLHNEIGGYNV